MEDRRRSIVYGILGFILILELGGLFYNSGIVSGVNERADKLKAYAIAYQDDSTIFPGDIYDREGNILAETSLKPVSQTDQDGNETERTLRVTSYNNAHAYSQLIGYTGKRSLKPSAESVDGVVGKRRDYRLMAFLDEDYWGENGLYSTAGPDGTKGQSAVLTIDNELQLAVYDALAKEMDESDSQGSAVVLDVKNGEILSMVAFPAYDFNDLETAISNMSEDEEKTNLEPGFPVSYKNAKAPGSIFKVFMTVALIDHGMEDFMVTDTSFVVEAWKCRNSYLSVGDTIGYAEALKRSSNVYFAQAALALGADQIRETARKFMLVEDVFEDADGDGKDDENTEYLRLDFGNVPYNWDLDVSDDILAQTGFGQGKTELTTVQAAMITQAIANDGVMMKPYLIKRLVDAEGKTVYEGKAEILSKATSKATADKVAEVMERTAQYSSVHYRGLGNTSEIFQRYRVAGKTGTAENGDAEDTTNAWFISFAPADDPQYVVVVNQCKTQKAGYKMMKTVAGVYEYLFETYRFKDSRKE